MSKSDGAILGGRRPRRILDLEDLARRLVGDGKAPNLFFVSRQGTILSVTRDFDAAYAQWAALPRNQESTLEDRRTGVLASVEPESDRPGARLIVRDDAHLFGPRRQTATRPPIGAT